MFAEVSQDYYILRFCSYCDVLNLCTARPGRVVGPVLPLEDCRNIKDEYGSRMSDRSAVLTPQAISSQCFYRTRSVNQEKSGLDGGMDMSQAKPQTQPQQRSATGNAVSGMADVKSNPYRPPHAKTDQLNDRMTIDAKLLQAQSQFGAAGAAAVAVAAHRNAGAIHYG